MGKMGVSCCIHLLQLIQKVHFSMYDDYDASLTKNEVLGYQEVVPGWWLTGEPCGSGHFAWSFCLPSLQNRKFHWNTTGYARMNLHDWIALYMFVYECVGAFHLDRQFRTLTSVQAGGPVSMDWFGACSLFVLACPIAF